MHRLNDTHTEKVKDLQLDKKRDVEKLIILELHSYFTLYQQNIYILFQQTNT